MKLKDLYEYNLKTQNNFNTNNYEYIETENYIFLKLDNTQFYTIYDEEYGLLSTDELNYYLSNMVIPSKINKDTLIDFFDDNHEYFSKIRPDHEIQEYYNFNNLKTIFSKNYMGYSDWDICNSSVDLDYELDNIKNSNIQKIDNISVNQIIRLTIYPATKLTKIKLKEEGKCYKFDNSNSTYFYYTNSNILSIPFIIKRK